jgi:phosphotransferase system HPr (HPr) family protein
VAEATIRIENPKGLHIRPIMDIADLSIQFESRILVHKGGRQAEGSSVMQLLALGIECGDELRIVAEGDDAQKAVHELVELIRVKLKDT